VTTAPLVDSKMFVPRPRSGLVERARLATPADRDRTRLTLVSAPPGFGKTTLLTSWLSSDDSAEGRRVAWVSLEESDARAETYWTYVLTALERAVPGTGAPGLALLQSGQVPIENILAVVVNELSVLPDDVELVLDDYHLVDGPEIQPGMAYLVDHLPPQVHLTISTRTDPALPLARLRVRGELTEVRAEDLRFTSEEAAAYLNESSGLHLTGSEVEALAGRTEGWIAALQLAALSLQGRADTAGFIAGFAGDDRYVVDYLLEEVLDRQPVEVRDFLLETSVLERLNADLCDAVTGASDGRAQLEALDRQNLFVVPLDDHRGWYRYHHLFGDVLRTHLGGERPADVAELHRRASRWYDEAGEAVPAVRHALAAGDDDRAADLVELAIPAQRQVRSEATIRDWVDALPESVLRNRPVLCIGLVGGLMASNEFAGVEERLREVERQLALPEDELVIVDRDELQRVPAAIEMYRAALALVAGNPAGTIEHAAEAFDRAADDDHLVRSAASALSGLASWTGGDLEAAHRGYVAAARGLAAAGHIADVLGCSITIADLEMTQGRLRQARRTLEQALELGEAESPTLRGIADMHVGLSAIARERDDLAAAHDHLGRSQELGDDAGLPQNPYRWRVALARLREAEGDLDGARDLLTEAIRVYVGDFSPDVRPVSAQRARVLARQGDLAAAREWVEERGLSASDELNYLREYEHLTLARILLAEHAVGYSDTALADSTGLLERLRSATDEGGRTGTGIEVLTLLALAREAAGDRDTALSALNLAIDLAEPEGFVRVFLDEGEPMAALLRLLSQRRPDSTYLRRLVDGRRVRAVAGGGRPKTVDGGLVDPLSERELDVLRMLASELDGPSIARELVVSLNTVRTHTKHIYAKLGVNSRRSAVAQARRRGLL
jgi:LuxR family maltose regulon positive regulatory protein